MSFGVQVDFQNLKRRDTVVHHEATSISLHDLSPDLKIGDLSDNAWNPK